LKQTADQRLQLDATTAKARLALASGNQQLALKRIVLQENRDAAGATTAAQKQAWAAAQTDAAHRTASGIIFHVVPGKDGSPVVEPWLLNGKPQLTVAARKALRPAGKTFSAKDMRDMNANAEAGARLAYQGGTRDGRAPEDGFTISKTDPGNGQPWAEPIEDPSGKLIGYRNHYVPLDFGTALQHAIESRIDPQIAMQHLLRYYKPGDPRGTPRTPRQDAQLRKSLKRAGVKTSQYVPNSELPKAEPGR
jgi:hypothetical protein